MKSRKIYCVMALEPICPDDRFLNQISQIPLVPAARLKYSVKYSIALTFQDRFKHSSIDELVEGCCGRESCPICGPFGFWKKGKETPGATEFSDMTPMFIPIDTPDGPVWCTSHAIIDVLTCAGLLGEDDLQIRLPLDSLDVQSPMGDGILTLSWLPLRVAYSISPLKSSARDKFLNMGVPREVLDRVVFTSDKVLAHLIRDNPESYLIHLVDPQTNGITHRLAPLCGMIPQGTIMWFSVGYFRRDGIIDVVEDGISHLEHIGVGGLTSREVGRIKLLKSKEV
ncbi:hypothetical protein J7M22_02225 [Candidatus Poribacteria bacterium]|nr:hypothetical protein [Candidatus Poribacteria bacterium]